MQVVIDIDENVYTRLFDNGTDFYDTDDILAMAKAIRKGTVLPKGHGRLIDADKLEPKETAPEAWYSPMWGFELDDIEDAPTIIEADKTRDCNSCAHSDQGRCAGTEVCHECMWSNKFIETDKGSEDKG